MSVLTVIFNGGGNAECNQVPDDDAHVDGDICSSPRNHPDTGPKMTRGDRSSKRQRRLKTEMRLKESGPEWQMNDREKCSRREIINYPELKCSLNQRQTTAARSTSRGTALRQDGAPSRGMGWHQEIVGSIAQIYERYPPKILRKTH